MPIPVELEDLESAIKGLHKRVIELKGQARDIVVARNQVSVELQQEQEAKGLLVARLAAVSRADVVGIFEYADAREELAVCEDRIFEGRLMVLDYEAKLKAVHDEIPVVEQLLRDAKIEHAEWGEVIPFPQRR